MQFYRKGRRCGELLKTYHNAGLRTDQPNNGSVARSQAGTGHNAMNSRFPFCFNALERLAIYLVVPCGCGDRLHGKATQQATVDKNLTVTHIEHTIIDMPRVIEGEVIEGECEVITQGPRG